MRANAFIQGLRDAIDARIRSVVKGDTGSIASMLITGKRDLIAPHLYDAMFVSGIGHVLSISGYHMAVVAGVVFFFLRAVLALIPGVADRMPIKKWAAFAALLVTAFYLVLSGAEVATQRSFIMIAIVLIGVMLDRPILTLRTVTIAALLVLFFAPEAVVHPSFQMSFAATLALVAAYSRGLPWTRPGADSSLGARAALWGVNQTAGLILASLVAGLATTPYAAYHFHRVAPYGVLANLLAMPVVSAWVMPMGLVGVLAMPFGFDAECWRQMGYGIDWMNAIALWVAGLPGAFGRVNSFGTGPLLLATAGLLAIGLLKTPLRWSGAALTVLAIIWAARAPVPDILVAADGRTFAVRGADGRLAFHHAGGDAFAIHEWLAADRDGRDPRDPGLGNGISCDSSGCIGKLADGRLVAYALAPDAFEEDCRRATVIVATRDAPPDCAATVIGRSLWRARGALALRRDGAGFVDRFRAAAEFRPAMGAECGAECRAASGAQRRGQFRRCSRSAGAIAVTTARRDTAAGRSRSKRLSGSVPTEQPDQLALNAHAVGRQDAHFISGIGGLERDRGAAAPEALQRRFLVVDQGDDDVAGVGGIAAFQKRDVAVEDSRFDHRIAAHFEREMLARAEQVGRHIDGVAAGLDRFDRRAGGDAAHHRHGDGPAAFVFRGGAHAAEISFNDARREAARAVRTDAVGHRLQAA